MDRWIISCSGINGQYYSASAGIKTVRKKVGLRLLEFCFRNQGNQEVGFTKPRAIAQKTVGFFLVFNVEGFSKGLSACHPKHVCMRCVMMSCSPILPGWG